MEKSRFFSELKSSLLIETEKIDETTPVDLSSLTTLVIIAFIDENFNKLVKTDELRNVRTVGDIINLVGSENLS